METNEETEVTSWVIGTNDPAKLMPMVTKFCEGKKILEKHYSASTTLVDVPANQLPKGLIPARGTIAKQPYTVLHCIIIFEQVKKSQVKTLN